MTRGTTAPSSTASPGLSRRWLYGILIVAFFFVLMPFLFWRATWFGRPLSDGEIAKYLADREHPRKAQHALSQIADRILSRDAAARVTAKQWYPQVIALSSSKMDELRITSAWVMGQDNTNQEFHAALVKLLEDPHPMVRRNAALSLVRFGDSSGRKEIRGMLQPYVVTAPKGGTFSQRLKPGDTVNPGTLLGRIQSNEGQVEIRSQVPGILERWLVSTNTNVNAGDSLAAISPSANEAWEALRALYLVGQAEDAPLIESYVRASADVPDAVRRQAVLSVEAIRERNRKE
jgi:biotin carboxyl carrier protein